MKRLLPLVALAVLVSACSKPEPEEIRFSVLGNSYSSLVGTVDPETNDVWELYPEIGVTDPEQMWWYQVSVAMEWVLEKNNSFSGSLICNLNASNYYGPHSYLRRMDNLGNPDVIFVFGGTNDVWDGAEFGDFVYSDWTEEQLCEIRPAVAYLFENLQHLYPRAHLYFLIDMDLCSGGVDEETKLTFINSVHRIADHYGVDCIELFGIQKTHWHPNVQGQEDIARQVIKAVSVDFNV